MNFRDEKILKALGEHLRKTRLNEGFTQEDLAYNSGLSLSQIARIETGRINPTVCTLIIIAQTLKIHPSELLKFKI